MGVLAGWCPDRGEPNGQTLRFLLTTGFLGGVVAFSTFSLDAALLWERGDAGMALVYVRGSVAMSLVAISLVGMFAGPFPMQGFLH